jgi:hypothetical protein
MRLGLASDVDYTPRVERKMVFAATQCGSFVEAEWALAELAGLSVQAKRIWRATQRAGQQRLAEHREAVEAYSALPLPARRESPAGATPPPVACVAMDGGRFQRRERQPGQPQADGDSGTCWREMKVGCLVGMDSETVGADPCPQLPPTFADPGRMREVAQEIKGFSADKDLCATLEGESDTSPAKRPGRPHMLHKSVVATARDVTEFGPLLAAAAYRQGFHAAPRKAFVADGSETNWGVWRKYFSHYTPIVDFVHALMYVYAAAMAGETSSVGWTHYRQWAQWLWGGAMDELLAALEARQQELGWPDTEEQGTPRAQVAESLRYLTNQRARMQYDEYRWQGLPITSTQVESTIKQINRRVKGTEKFWADGIESMLTLVADHLSQPLTPASASPLRYQHPAPLCLQAA